MDGARGVLLSIAGGSDLGLFEINDAAQLVTDAAHPDANIIFGAVIDDALGDEVRVTVIAAGFDGGAPAYRPVEARAPRPQHNHQPKEPAQVERQARRRPGGCCSTTSTCRPTSRPQLVPSADRFRSPAPLIAHIVAAGVYALAGTFQLVPRLRRDHPNWHRRAGRVLSAAGLVVAGWLITLAVAGYAIRRRPAP